jgi:hypothetical protein
VRRPRELAAGVVRATGVPRAREHTARLDRAADAIVENARLAVLLEQQVAAIEQDLVPLLEAAVRAAESTEADDPEDGA